jgi:hypothetical protein
MQQLIYASAAVKLFRASDLYDLLATARKFNADHDISGMMIYHARSILQVLEGPEENLADLFIKIRRDPRHTALRLIARSAVEKKEFECWSMGLVSNARKGPDIMEFSHYSAIQVMSMDVIKAKTMLSLYQRGAWRRLADH